MNKSQAIFQEIENKLVKDDYASSLPTYHPAKGRRKRVRKDPVKVYQTKENSNSGLEEQHSIKSQEEDSPDTSPEIEEPDEEEILPGRDFPGHEIDLPEEEELPEEEPDPEYEDPDEEEFDR